MVISQWILERGIGNRVSKSATLAVKEQRVDGRPHGVSAPCGRCTLINFERNFLLNSVLINTICKIE